MCWSWGRCYPFIQVTYDLLRWMWFLNVGWGSIIRVDLPLNPWCLYCRWGRCSSLRTFASSVEAGTSPGDEVDVGAICLSSSPSKPYSFSSLKILSSISVTPWFSQGNKILENHLCIDNYVCCIHAIAYFIVWWSAPVYFVLRVEVIRSLNLNLDQNGLNL
jgi:hypothetical protein